MSRGDSIIPLILAGGKGSRVAHVRSDLPKPALPVAGRPFLAWILEQLHAADFDRAVVSSGHLADVLEKEVSQHIPPGMEVCWVQESRPLGTGGAIAHAVGSCGWRCDRWLVMNGDSYLGGEWPARITSKANAALCARLVEDAGRYGGLSVRDGNLHHFAEKGATGGGLINAGIYVMPADWIQELPRDQNLSLEQEILPQWLEQGRAIAVVEENGPFIDIGTPETLVEAEGFMTALHHHSIS